MNPDEDWLNPPEPEDESWLDEPATASSTTTQTLPTDIVERAKLIESCWQFLTTKQKMFLDAYRECHFNARRAAEYTKGVVSRTAHIRWVREDYNYETVVRIWEADAARHALNPERLLRRQEEIVERALEEKDILHQGVPTGFRQADLATAARANVELLDRAVPKNQEEKTRVVVNIVRLTGEADPGE